MKAKESIEFTKAYSSLNPQQREAVDTTEGPVMVVAGPGTGKTQILTLRIANILRTTDTEPENILALTFTEAAAANMRKRLTRIIGSDGYQVQITTFHSFANDIIQSNPDDFPAIIGAQPMTEVDQIRTIQDIITNTELKYLKPFGDTFFYVRPALSAINNLKREGVTIEHFAKIIEREEKDFENNDDIYHIKGVHIGKMKGKYQLVQKKIEKNKELLILYKKYQEQIRTDKRYDFTDMIMEVVKVLEHDEDLLLRLQETHQYILVDEHQDTNNAQNRLLELLANFHDNPNLFVVGDEKQSIYRFQGANLENFSYFKKVYPGARLIALEQNYRSPQGVLNTAHSLIAGPVALQSQAEHANTREPIEVIYYPDSDSEVHGVVERIQTLRQEGVPLEEIALLYRNNRDAVALSRGLKKSGIPHLVESHNDIFSDPLTYQFITLIRAIADFGNDTALARALHLDIVDANPLDIVTVIRSASQKKKYSLYDCLKNKSEHLSDLVLYKPEALDSFFKNLEHWVQLSFNQDLVTVVEAVIRESGLLQSIIGGTEPEQGMHTLNALFDQVRQMVVVNPEAHLRDFLNALDMMHEHGIALEKNLPNGTPGYVRLMTAHRSKGQEFEYVIIVHTYNGNWGNKMRRETLPLLDGVFRLSSPSLDEERGGGGVIVNDSSEEDDTEIDNSLDDERRLFYVALTRAKKHVLITVPRTGHDGRELLPSQFLQEIDQSLVVWNTNETRKAFLDDYIQEVQEFGEQQASTRAQMQEFVRESFLKQGLSVSALNNYLQSPWQYFFRNLVRIPSVPDKFQAYGIAVHAALNDLFESLKEGEEASEQFLLDRFDMHLESQAWSQTIEYQDTQDKGYQALSAWYQEYHSTFVTYTLNEFRINGVQLKPDIRLTGVLDKIECIEGSDRLVNVVDYKTGKSKSRKQLMGETKDADGNYYRQLVFYKLLLKHFKDGKYIMESGEIDFIEPDDKGKLHKEKFIISDEEVMELEETIKRVGEEIMNLTFWDTPCDPETCDYADLVNAIKK